jgi:hypothetical protein
MHSENATPKPNDFAAGAQAALAVVANLLAQVQTRVQEAAQPPASPTRPVAQPRAAAVKAAK